MANRTCDNTRRRADALHAEINEITEALIILSEIMGQPAPTPEED